jgi:hypothetical protein
VAVGNEEKCHKGEGFGVMLVRVVMKVGKAETCHEEGKEVWHGDFLEFNKLAVRYMILN